MNNAKILTQIVSIDGCTVKMSFTQEDNIEAVQEIKDILVSTLEYPHNLQLFSEGGVADERTV